MPEPTARLLGASQVRDLADRLGIIAKGLLRYTLAWPSVLSGLGLAWALVDADRQFLHDRIAGSRIVLMPPVKD